jgi:methylated-DNA-[protein]-cysteine S-methyltransferase
MNCSVIFESPIGPLRIVANDDGLCAIDFPTSRHASRIGATDASGASDSASAVLRTASQQLVEYFAGTRYTFDLPLAPHGTQFQRAVWQALTEIPYGQTASYAQLATRLGRPTATRAVGAANGRNPLPIVLPCHRVIGADGSLTGFAGGLDTKRFLLALEGAWPKGDLFAA